MVKWLLKWRQTNTAAAAKKSIANEPLRFTNQTEWEAICIIEDTLLGSWWPSRFQFSSRHRLFSALDQRRRRRWFISDLSVTRLIYMQFDVVLRLVGLSIRDNRKRHGQSKSGQEKNRWANQTTRQLEQVFVRSLCNFSVISSFLFFASSFHSWLRRKKPFNRFNKGSFLYTRMGKERSESTSFKAAPRELSRWHIFSVLSRENRIFSFSVFFFVANCTQRLINIVSLLSTNSLLYMISFGWTTPKGSFLSSSVKRRSSWREV